MPEFLVSWYVEVSADGPKEAAQKALEMQRDPDSTAVVFMVSDPVGGRTRIDLLKEPKEKS